MIRPSLAALAATLLTACSTEPIVVQNTGRTVELTGGPASISSTAEGIAYHQTGADRLCRERGFSGAQSAGISQEAFITSYLFTCLT